MSFSSTYDVWLNAGEKRNEEAERELAQSYRRAWSLGDADEQTAVLHFLLLTQRQEGVDLVREGLNSDDPNVAPTAAAVATALLVAGIDVGEGIRTLFEQFAARFPQWSAFATASLNILNGKPSRHLSPEN